MVLRTAFHGASMEIAYRNTVQYILLCTSLPHSKAESIELSVSRLLGGVTGSSSIDESLAVIRSEVLGYLKTISFPSLPSVF